MSPTSAPVRGQPLPKKLSPAITLAFVAVATAVALTGSGTLRANSYLRGVNLASGEFAPEKIPGEYARDYVYPDEAVAKPFAKAGMNAVRVPILWERIQPAPFAELSSEEMVRVDRSIAALDAFSTIIIDVHNYGRYRGKVLDSQEGAAMLADLWGRLGRRYSPQAKVAFGIMNEPHGIEARVWRSIAERTVGSIRSAGARNLILVPGTNWTGAHSWSAGGDGSNGAAFRGFRDPGGNFMYELHQYVDQDSSGTSASCVTPEVAESRMIGATDWLRAEGQRAVLAEFGAPPSESCLSALRALLAHVEGHQSTWGGWTYWAGGPWWAGYAMSIQPQDDEARPQMNVLRPYLSGGQ